MARNLFAEEKTKGRNLFSSDATEEEAGPTLGQQAVGSLETAATLVSGALAEPVAGLKGVYEQFTGGDPVKAIEETRESLTYKGGKESQEQVKGIGEFISPVTDIIGDVESGLGDYVLEKTGSPELAAAAHSIPTALLEVLGLKGVGRAKPVSKGLTKSPKEILSKTSPKKEELKTFSRGVYKEIDEAGAVIKQSEFSGLSKNIERDLKSQGYNKRVHPKLRGVIEELSDMDGSSPKVGELDTLRKVARGASKSIEPDEARLAGRVIDKIDSFMDGIDNSKLNAPTPIDIGGKFKQARSTWAKAKKIETVDDIMYKAELSASGFENGIRQGFTSLLKNKKRLRGFNSKEIRIMENISKGGPIDNTLKRIGKLGFGEGKSGSLIGTTIGATGGLAAFGGPGAIAVPIIGQVSRSLSQVLTKNKSALLKSVVGAGNDGAEIVKAYLKHVPRKNQSASSLSELLLKSNITPDEIKRFANISGRLKEDLIYYANQVKGLGQIGVVGIPGSTEALNQE